MNIKFSKQGNIVYINDKKYGVKYLQEYLPFCIEYNYKLRKCYLIDRNYNYMGFSNIKFLDKLENNVGDWQRIYLYSDSTKPWNSKKNLLIYINKYYEEISDYNIIGKHNILNNFDFITLYN